MSATAEIRLEDCMNYMRNCKDKEFNLCICDPPYGMPERSGQGAGKLQDRIIQKMHQSGWDIAPPLEYFTELMRISENQIIWGGNYFGLPSNRCFVIWDKEQPFENFSACEYAWTSFDSPAKIFKEPTTRTGETKIHPTQKSVKLYKFLLHHYAKPGDKIFDSHAGSASSVIAALNMGFDITACEIDVDYFEAAKIRIENHFLQTNMFAEKPEIKFIR